MEMKFQNVTEHVTYFKLLESNFTSRVGLFCIPVHAAKNVAPILRIIINLLNSDLSVIFIVLTLLT